MKFLLLALILGSPLSVMATGEWNIRMGAGTGLFKTYHTTTTGTNFIAIEQTSTGVGEAFVQDDFTNTNNLVITTTTHFMDIGGNWNEHPNYTSGNFIFSSNRARSSDANTGCYYSTAIPASINYYVETVIYQQGSTIPGMGPAGRINTSANTMYFARYSSSAGEWQLWKVVSSAVTQLGGYTASTSNGASYTLRLSMVDHVIKVYLNTVEIIAVTDTSILDKGKAGIRGSSSSGGHHIDSVIAVNQ